MNNIDNWVKNIKSKEQESLQHALYKHGELLENTYRYTFKENEEPLIASYFHDEPTDIVVLQVEKRKGFPPRLLATDKEGYCEPELISCDEVFAGQLQYVTSYII